MKSILLLQRLQIIHPTRSIKATTNANNLPVASQFVLLKLMLLKDTQLRCCVAHTRSYVRPLTPSKMNIYIKS